MKKLNILVVCDAVIRQVGGAFISPLRFSELLKKKSESIAVTISKARKKIKPRKENNFIC